MIKLLCMVMHKKNGYEKSPSLSLGDGMSYIGSVTFLTLNQGISVNYPS